MPEIITGQDGSLSYETGAGTEEAARVEAARAELYDEAQGDTSEGDSGLLLGKYRSAEDLAEAYKSLQAEYTRLKGGAQQQETEPLAETDDDDDDDDDNADEGQAGQIDAETATAIQQRVFDMAGGQDGYTRLANWVAGNLPADRVNSWNEALAQGNEGQILTTLKGLQYDYMMANGYEPRLTGGRAPSNEVRGYSSEAQVVQAMSDPRYSGDNPDPAYIREVERRIAASNVFQAR
ncbi:capsid assembly protein [Vulcanococcus sp.]|uniref:capsid assembly protein n=1 Tax=Vulcanococcus sp. TaxID=2856995 RepID=UPI003F69FCD5